MGQAVVVSAGEPSPFGGTVRLYQRENGAWHRVGEAMPAVFGRNGLAGPGEKREGDGRTPGGIFSLERGFGYEPLQTAIPYIVLTQDMIWIDDPSSPLYNTLVRKGLGQGASHEIMRRADDLYKYGIVIEYNTHPVVSGAGSAIFFHIRRDGKTPTAGCVAMTESDILRILRWLDPRRHPAAVIGAACP
nr:L,D-transpeptidase family protein [Geotalea sp. SG265]